MGRWKSGQGRESRRVVPVQVGRGYGCWKAPHNSEFGLGFGLSAEPKARTGHAWGQQCSAHVGAAALKLWKVRGEEVSPKPDSSGKRDACAFLFCFVSLFLLKGRVLLYERHFFIVVLRWQLFRQVEITAFKRWQFVQ